MFLDPDAVVAEIMWLMSLFLELHLACIAPPSIFCDSSSVVQLAANPIMHNRTKHFEQDLNLVHDKMIQCDVFVSHISSQDQIADILTKPPSASMFLNFNPNVGLQPPHL